MAELSRRAFLGGMAAVAVVGCSSDEPTGDAAPTTSGAGPTTSSGPPELPADIAAVAIAADPFTLGVASGDPDETSVVLWTRLAPDPFAAGAGIPADATSIAVEVAPDDAFTDGVRAGRFAVDVERGHSVHAVFTDLEPATEYRYRFRIGPWTSPVGTTRTAPTEATTVRLAVASCQRYDHGFYAAHRSIAAADVDLVVFLGDYIYEAATTSAPARPLPGPLGVLEAADLEGYRHRYVAARLDADLAAAHAAHPWAITWDDHEVVNNYAGGDGESVPAGRRAAGYQAWWEHQPVRLPPPPADGVAAFPIHRSVRWGPLLDLLLLDTRQHRDAEPCGGGAVEVESCADLALPERSLLGAEQEGWLAEQLAGASGTWTVLAQSVVLAPVEALGLVNVDAWDGYAGARTRLLDAMTAAEIVNPVVLTGDVHVALVADVPRADGTIAATEFVAPSISSRADDRFGDAVSLLPVVAPDVVFGANHRGWLRCELTESAATATFFEVTDPILADSAVTEGRSFTVAAGTPGAQPG